MIGEAGAGHGTVAEVWIPLRLVAIVMGSDNIRGYHVPFFHNHILLRLL